jgi:L-asparaginase
VADLLAAVPALARFDLQAEQVAQVDSKDMTLAVLAQLTARAAHHLARPEVAGLVITHGTDTLEETAWLLHRVLQPAKPVVLTAAMRPANAIAADGPLNLHDAVAVAADAGSPPGVWLAFGSRVFHGAWVRKVHTWRLDAFEGGGQSDAGEVCEGRVRWFGGAGGIDDGVAPSLRAWPPLPTRDDDWPWVEIVASHAGASGRAVDALVAAGVQGLVVAATGNGSWHESLRPALQRARQAGVALLRATRCAAGGIAGEDRDELVPSAGHLTPAQARVELALRLLAGTPPSS